MLVLTGILILGIGYGAFAYESLRAEFLNQQQEFEKRTGEFQSRIIELEGTLAHMEDENEELEDDLRAEKKKNRSFEDQIDDIADTVGTLDKLSRIDRELLQKYSKVYFLNEHYVPPRIVDIDREFVFPAGKDLQIHAEVWPQLEDLLEDAQQDNIPLRVISAYRSFGTQESLKSGYKVVYGTGANQFSADQGYSEHQLGTTVDFTTPSVGTTFTGFEKTTAYTWLSENAHRYGFVLSYPQNNAYYQYEPWHWRYVGTDLARTLRRKKMNFYDMDQREIDTYLVDIFD